VPKDNILAIGGFPLKPSGDSCIDQFIRTYHSFLVAVDGGLKVFYRLNVLPDILIGDLDSLNREALNWYLKHSRRLLLFQKDKDFLDMEAVLDLAKNERIKRVRFFGVFGGRMDQSFACYSFLEKSHQFGIELTIHDNNETMGLIKGPGIRQFETASGRNWSFLPLDKKVTGLTLKGFQYNIDNEVLIRAETRAISNQSAEQVVNVKLKSGTIIYFNNSGRSFYVECRKPFEKESE